MDRPAGSRAGMAAALLGLAAACAAVPAGAEEATVTPTFRSSRSGTSSPLATTLDQIDANDQRILAKFDQIMEELKIVKIRVLRSPQTPP